MKFVKVIIMVLLSIFLSNKCFSQLVADAGNDTAFCASNWEGASIGGNPSAIGGTEPYIYAWSAEYKYAGRTYTASHMLVDTTVANPVFTGYFQDSAVFHLAVTDSKDSIAFDSVTVRFSQYIMCLGECRIEIALGDSVKIRQCCISGGIPPYQFSWTPVESLSDPTTESPWAKPQVNTTYELVLTDSIGCQAKSYSTVVVDTFGQYFAPLGATWYYGNRENPFGGPEAGYLLVKSVSKMVINKHHARVLAKTYYASDGTIHDRGYEFVYTEGNKVFYIKDQRSFLLYDFTAETGDTLKFREPFFSSHNSNTTFTMVVDSTDFISVDGTELKRMYLRDISWHWDLYRTHIERIGNMPYMFPQIGLYCDAACYDPLRCYSDHSIVYKPVSYECDKLVTGITDQYSTERIRIFPNPASSVVNFLFEHPDFINSLLLLFSADGKLVNEIVVCDQNVSVDITGYKQGVYFYNWIITENEVEAGKFVVE